MTLLDLEGASLVIDNACYVHKNEQPRTKGAQNELALWGNFSPHSLGHSVVDVGLSTVVEKRLVCIKWKGVWLSTSLIILQTDSITSVRFKFAVQAGYLIWLY